MNGCLVVMQPSFLPWAGYFNLMSQAEFFVFLNDAQLVKQSWQTRNRLIMNGSTPQWISVPVLHKQLNQSIVETEVLDVSNWRAKLGRGFTQSYSKHYHFKDALEVVNALIEHPSKKLGDINEAIIRFIASKINLRTNIYRSSELGIEGVRTKRLISFCEHFKASVYLSPQGAAEYLEEDGFEVKTSTRLQFQNYQPTSYIQKGIKDFQPHLSILDVLANLGWEKTRRYIYKGTI